LPTLLSKAGAANKWFQDIDEMCSILRKKRRLGGYERVRIAILDSGLDESHPSYWQVKKDYEDFIGKQNDRGVDNTGHGTNGFHLILKIIPEVDIYVARVFDGREATPKTPVLMAEVKNREK
jgi:hypothetical protein